MDNTHFIDQTARTHGNRETLLRLGQTRKTVFAVYLIPHVSSYHQYFPTSLEKRVW